MYPLITRFTTILVPAATAIVLSACGSTDTTRADMAEAELDALQEALGETELTPDAITTLKSMIATLMGRSDITPADLQALRDQVAMLEGRANITPMDLQALHDRVAILEGRANITPTDLQALRDQVAMLEGRGDLAPGVPVPTGLIRNPGSVFLNDDDEGDQRIFLAVVPTLAAGIRRDYDEQRSELTNDAYIKSTGVLNVGTGDEAEEVLLVTYVAGDEEVTVPFTDADLDSGDDYSWTKTIDGVEYWGWLRGADQLVNSFNLISGLPGYRLYATAGFRTETADLPSGTAVYGGAMRGDTHLTNDPSSGRESISGSLSLTANFDAGSLEGRISDIRVRSDDPRVWSDLPDTTYFAIDSGRIVDGQFTASLTGMDSNADASMNETVLGYEGGVLGEFYGPAAKEVGGVLNASRDDRVMAGAFGAVTTE